MNQPDDVSIIAPSLPKGGGAIQSIGKGWGAVGASGAASFALPLPISPGRGFSPQLAFSYRSSVGNSLFGLGWGLSLSHVARRTNRGVPAYTEDDEVVGPSGDVWIPERDRNGAIQRESVSRYSDLDLNKTYEVTRHYPRVESDFARIEHWRSADDLPGFWLMHGADGSLHLFGKNKTSRIADPDDDQKVGEWLLEESMNAHGEHILYEYKPEDHAGMPDDPLQNYRAQRYVSRIRYGNFSSSSQLYLWDPGQLSELKWHFDLLFDYGERATAFTDKPDYLPAQNWPVRSDPYSSYAYGFLLGSLRLCRQVLMFHYFPLEDDMGAQPQLVLRLLLQHRATALSFQHLTAAHLQGYDADGGLASHPPMEFAYAEFDPGYIRYQAFDAMPGLNDGQPYQLVDLYGEGLPGVLYPGDKGWYYREPMRAEPAQQRDDVAYSEWRLLPAMPVIDRNKPVRQFLSDITGDGRLDWTWAQPGLSGFFTLNPDRSWSAFAMFAAFPQEFFHPQGQLADLMGDGLSDMAMIGTRSVRLYANRRDDGFAKATETARVADEDALPLLSDSATELVAFSDVLGSGQQHLIRIRHNELRCWPNLGRGRFGKSFRLAALNFAYGEFDASRVRLADLDGSGAADLIYLTPEHAEIFMNRAGNGFEATPRILPWPPGVRYDRLCQVSTADLQGLGCSSLILTVPHMSPRHWRCDFVQAKPYLMAGTNNNMGTAGGVTYRSSAQEWLDEKKELLAIGKPAASYVPFPVHVTVEQTQLDEITGNLLTQHFQYRQGYYDSHEREFRGFGLLLQTDTESDGSHRERGFTAPVQSKAWFHTGRFADMPTEDFDASDGGAQPLGPTLLLNASGGIIKDADEPTRRDMARTLSGMPLRVEVFGLDGDLRRSALPYSVQQTRYSVRLLRSRAEYRQPYSSMQPVALESIAYQYERQPDDPRCDHSINLAWDTYGGLIHGVAVNYARRKRESDEPPFSEEHERTWWRDAHDEAQAFYYLNESRAEFIHLDLAQSWRLGLPYRMRGDALKLTANELTPETINYECFAGEDSPLKLRNRWVLTGLTLQRYQGAEQGAATFEALADYLESAELDETALKAYEAVMTREELESELREIGYQRMPAALPADGTTILWSTRKGFATYAGLAGFYKVLRFKATESLGETRVDYDPYHCLPMTVTAPDGCTTRVTDYDYRCLLPRQIVDPNQNTQEARYDGFGEIVASSFYGTEQGEAVGFHPLSEFEPFTQSPENAIGQADNALQGAATAHFKDAFSWMGRIPAANLSDPAWVAHRVASGDMLPSGHICASARTRLARSGPFEECDDPALAAAIQTAVREPVHSLGLQADRYPEDPERQIRMSISAWDGFGRTLQAKQKVEPGPAYKVDGDGNLVLEDGQPVIVPDAERWRISERVEYNNKGLPIRVYRPYFADQHRYINDVSFRQFGYCDQQFYDPLGRPTLTLTANGYFRRQRYLTWYTISEDENDMATEPASEVLALAEQAA